MWIKVPEAANGELELKPSPPPPVLPSPRMSVAMASWLYSADLYLKFKIHRVLMCQQMHTIAYSCIPLSGQLFLYTSYAMHMWLWTQQSLKVESLLNMLLWSTRDTVSRILFGPQGATAVNSAGCRDPSRTHQSGRESCYSGGLNYLNLG